MSGAKTIAIIGIPDEEAAHLRLLLRKGAPDLDHRWRWGDESDADLVVVDPRSFAGQMARTRAQGAGIRCAIFSDNPVERAELVLRRPLRLANVIAVLNQAASAFARDPEIESNTADFYTRDLGDEGPDGTRAGVDTTAGHANVVPGLDDLLRPQPAELRTAQEWTPQPVAAPAADAPSVSSLGDVPQDAAAPSATPASAAPTRHYATRAAMLADTTPYGLRAYLEGDLLHGAARYALPGMPSLVLDPKHKVAHAPVELGALGPYCRQHWRLCDWQPLTSAELAELCATQPPLPYARLLWLDVLLHSGGHLAAHLDPGGTYRLKHRLEIDPELSKYFRIASAMLQPMRLHEIAAASGAPMADVFDLVNACDAVGLIEWQPRPRRDDRQPPKPSPSLLKKLRKPFAKS